MRVLLVFCACLVICIGICLADVHVDVDPGDILSFDPTNVKMKQREEGVEEENKSQDLNSSSNEKLSRDQGEDTQDVKDATTQTHCLNWKDLALKPLFKRYIMSLVQHLETQMEASEGPAEFCMKMRGTWEDNLLFKHYGLGTTEDVHKVFEKLEKMMLYTMDLPDQGGPVYWLEMALGLSSPVLFQMIAVLSLVIIAAKTLVTVRITRSFVTKAILFAFIISTMTTYIELYQKKVANQRQVLTDEIGNKCPHLSESLLTRLSGYLSSSLTFQHEDCVEYYEASFVDPLFQVSILEAGAIAFMKTLMAPMKIVGHGLKDFLIGLFKDLPFQYSVYLSVILTTLFIITPFLLCGYTIRVPLLLSLHPTPSSQPQIKDSKEKQIKDQKCLCNHEQLPQVGTNIQLILTDSRSQTSLAEERVLTSQSEVQLRRNPNSDQPQTSEVTLDVPNQPQENNLILKQSDQLTIKPVLSEPLEKNITVDSESKTEIVLSQEQDRACGEGYDLAKNAFLLDEELRSTDGPD